MTTTKLDNVKAILCDIDGVIWDSQDNKTPNPGVHETIRYLKEEKRLPMRFVTNTTTRSLSTLYNDIAERGFPIERDELVTPPKLAADFLRRRGRPRLMLVMQDDTKEEFRDFPIDHDTPEFIVIGNLGDRWDFPLINTLFNKLTHGAELLALHKQRYWLTEGEIKIDIGFFVTGLEYVTGKQAIVIGKPEPLFFTTALDEIGVAPEHALMIGDDIESDIGGAQRAGLRGVLIRAGKYRELLVQSSPIQPFLTIDSLAELRTHL